MHFRPDMPERAAWFTYSRRPGKVSATPANARGWLALAGCIMGTVLVGRLVFRLALASHPVLAFAALISVITLGVLFTVWLAVVKGRQEN
jgi:hypothetical protein